MTTDDRELAIEAKLKDIRAGCRVLLLQLDQLQQLLGADAELTPVQYAELAATLGSVGLAGVVIMTDDVERTARREGIEP